MLNNHYSTSMVTITKDGAEHGLLIAGGLSPRNEKVEFNEVSGDSTTGWKEVASLPTILSSLSMSYSDEKKKVFAFGGYNGKQSTKFGKAKFGQWLRITQEILS